MGALGNNLILIVYFCGPCSLASGVVTGLGLLGYQFFKSQDKSQNSFYIERAESGGPGELGPKDPKDDKDEKNKNEKSCTYKDITKPGSQYPNTETNLTKQHFEKNLQDDGWKRLVSKDGRVNIYEKNGSRYSVRNNSKSTNGPTADYYAPESESISGKIRLVKE